MKNRMVYLCGVLVLVAGLATNAAAVKDGPDGPGREKAENVRERIETLRMWKMTKALELDEKTSAQAFPIMNKFDKRRAGLEIALRQDMRELRESVPGANEGQLRKLLERVEQNHDSLQRLNEDEWKELKQVFTIAQQAKYILFKQDFDREMRQMIGEARERRMERRAQQPDGAPPRPAPQR